MQQNSSGKYIFFPGVTHAEKYNSGNIIAKKLVNGFLRVLLDMVHATGSSVVHEVGCGEGHILAMLAANGYTVRGSDISESSLRVAQQELSKQNLQVPLVAKSVYDLDKTDQAPTVLCCEVLEHLEDPVSALNKLMLICEKDLILSVPNEPLWRILNCMRGKYLTALGNTPGHIQHWTSGDFKRFVGTYAEIVSVSNPLPWTVLHCRPRKERR